MSQEDEKPMENQDSEEVQLPETPAQNELAKLQQQLESKEQENKSLQDKYLRLYAEFENYKKRVARDQEEFSKYANERLLKEFLPIVDNLERAILHSKEAKESSKILEGLELIRKQCLEVLGKFGVNAFESLLQPFDPFKHQAIGQLESDNDEDGTVVEEVQKGYGFNDRILRPAMVMVSKKKKNEAMGNSDKSPDQGN